MRTIGFETTDGSAGKLADLARHQRAVVLGKAAQILDAAGSRPLSPAELGLIDELAREAERLDDRAHRFERVDYEVRGTAA